jgi:hypothetical protein
MSMKILMTMCLLIKPKMKKTLITLVLTFNVFVVFSQIGWKNYSENKFSLKYPDSWVVRTSNGAIFFTSPKINSNDSFQENVNLMQQDLSGSPMTLEQYTELTRKQVVDNLGNSAIVSLTNKKERFYTLSYFWKFYILIPSAIHNHPFFNL